MMASFSPVVGSKHPSLNRPLWRNIYSLSCILLATRRICRWFFVGGFNKVPLSLGLVWKMLIFFGCLSIVRFVDFQSWEVKSPKCCKDALKTVWLCGLHYKIHILQILACLNDQVFSHSGTEFPSLKNRREKTRKSFRKSGNLLDNLYNSPQKRFITFLWYKTL